MFRSRNSLKRRDLLICEHGAVVALGPSTAMNNRYRALTLFAISSFAAAGCASDADSQAPGGFGKADDLSPGDVPALFEHYSIVATTDLTMCKGTPGVGCDEDETSYQVEVHALFTTTGQDGDRFSATIELCDGAAYDLTKGGESIGSTLDSSRFVNDILGTLEPISLTGTFVSVDGVPALTIDPMAVLIGAKLGSPLNDTLPADDKSLAGDTDKDGKQGITIKAPVGKVYGGTRIIADRWQLPLSGDEVLRGPADYRADFAIYDDSVPFVNVRKKVETMLAETHVPSISHQVTMMPVGDTTCAQVTNRFR